jgi:hypothetical protein
MVGSSSLSRKLMHTTLSNAAIRKHGRSRSTCTKPTARLRSRICSRPLRAMSAATTWWPRSVRNTAFLPAPAATSSVRPGRRSGALSARKAAGQEGVLGSWAYAFSQWLRSFEVTGGSTRKRSRENDGVHGRRALVSKRTRTRPNRRGRSAHVVDQEDALAFDRAAGAHREGEPHVVLSCPFAEPDLRWCGSCAPHQARVEWETEATRRLSSQQQGLVEPPAPQPVDVQRYGSDDVERLREEGKAVGKQRRQRRRHGAPARVFQRAERDAERIVVLVGGAVASNGSQAPERWRIFQTSPTKVARRTAEREPACRAVGLCNPAHPGQAVFAERRIGGRFAADTRPREQRIGDPFGHRPGGARYGIFETGDRGPLRYGHARSVLRVRLRRNTFS